MRTLVLVLFAALGLFACKTQHIYVAEDAGPECEDNLELVNGTCMFVCHRDGDCMAQERCNLFTGQCETKAPPPDAGPTPDMCTTGATRCTMDKKGIETCQANATWMTTTTCPPPGGFCQDDKCLVCQPGVATCDPMDMTKLDVCKDDGSAIDVITCTMPATCQSNECRACTPNTYRCSPDGKSLQQCTKGSDPSQTWSWTNIGDNFDGTCITGQCVVGGTNGYQCVAPQCFPGQIQCKDTMTAQTCGTIGNWVDQACTAPAECETGVCVDECGDAVAAKSYFGCDYWTSVMDNGVDPLFKGGVMSGQGALGDNSEFAFVVANRSGSPATVTITRYFGGAMQTLPAVMVPGSSDPATHGVKVIQVPWQSIADATQQQSVSGQARYGYRLQSTKPLTVYQFNPLSASTPVQPSQSCGSDADCSFGDGTQTCKNGHCNLFAFSNDASLLLPAHILGTSYVVMSSDHLVLRSSGPNSAAAATPFLNASVTIVATQDNTMVTVKATATTLAGTTGAIASIARNGTKTFALNSYDVLTLATDNPSDTSAARNLKCGFNPFNPGNDANTCNAFPTFCDYICGIDNADLTGSIVTSDKPVAVFGGASCSLFGAGDAACDHVEEQLFPFATWGQDFVAARTHPLRLLNGTFATTSAAGPDYYKIVAGCPSTACPGGTAITLSAAPAAADVITPSHCASGSLSANTCTLTGGTFIEFRSKQSFTIHTSAPVAVGQFFAGENASGDIMSANPPAEGDPSFVLLPPVQQWRSSYTVLTAPDTKDNYLGLVIDSSRVQAVSVDGTNVTGWTAVAGSTTFQLVNATVPNGTHLINVVPKANQPPLPDGGVNMSTPGVGVTVYGFDSYVSYGYTGGLDLQSIVTGINPGG